MNKRKQRIALLEQGVNGIAEMYADLTAQMEHLQTKVNQAPDLGKLEDRVATMEESLAKLLAQVSALAGKVADVSLQAKADYYTRGVLDEYMYGADKGVDQWKTR